MLFYFAWVEEMEAFNPKTHARQDEEVFNLRILEQEGLYPTATITVPRLEERKPLSFAIISCQINDEVHFLFKGRLVRFPISLEGETHTLEFVAEPSDADAQVKAIAQTLQQHPYYDPLFLSKDQRLEPDLHECLDARDDLPYWPRTMEGLRLSNIFQGRHTVDLEGSFFYDSLSIQVTDAPLKQVDVELCIQWRQRCRGEAFLDHLLQAALPDGMLSTLTGQDLEERWWKEGGSIGRSGYHLVHSALNTVDMVHSTLPKTSPSFWVSPHDPLSRHCKDKAPRQIKLKKSWYRPQLRVGWRYCQKRVEKLFLSLVNDAQPLGYRQSRTRSLRLHLHDIVAAEQHMEWQANRMHVRGERVVQDGRLFVCLRTHRAGGSFGDDAINWQDQGTYHPGCSAETRGTFFATDRGQQAVEHAIEIARAHLAASTRAVEVKAVCDLSEALDLTCDHTVTITDDRLPGKRITGKVKRLVLEVEGQTGWATASITLACSLGTGRMSAMPSDKRDVYAENYFGINVISDGLYRQTVSGISYRSCFDHVPERGHTFPAFLGASDILKGVAFSNTANDQEDFLKEKQYPHGHNLEHSLSQVKTGVKIWFEDLRSVAVLEHHIHVDIPHPWSAPRHIDLE